MNEDDGLSLALLVAAVGVVALFAICPAPAERAGDQVAQAIDSTEHFLERQRLNAADLWDTTVYDLGQKRDRYALAAERLHERFRASLEELCDCSD